MKYCRFENTLSDLEDCYSVIKEGEELSPSEEEAKKKLLELCEKITENIIL